jgi:hypothetical protein
MFETVAKTFPVFPAASTNSKENEPFSVKRCVEPPLLVMVIGSLGVTSVATTSAFVGVVVL